MPSANSNLENKYLFMEKEWDFLDIDQENLSQQVKSSLNFKNKLSYDKGGVSNFKKLSSLHQIAKPAVQKCKLNKSLLLKKPRSVIVSTELSLLHEKEWKTSMDAPRNHFINVTRLKCKDSLLISSRKILELLSKESDKGE